MKFLVLALCLGCVLANESLLDELDTILSSSAADSKDISSQVDSKTADPLHDVMNLLSEDSDDQENDDLDLLEKRLSFDKPVRYCLDGVTKARGSNQLGCPRALCYDRGYCSQRFASELKIKDSYTRRRAIKHKCLDRYFSTFWEECPFTCEFCKPPSPQKTCRKKFGTRAARFGCCVVGGSLALNAEKRGCLPCRDLFGHVCKQFMTSRFGMKCHTGSYRIRSFLHKYCPLSCGLCKKGEL